MRCHFRNILRVRNILLAVSMTYAHASTAEWFIAPQLALTKVDTSESAADFDNVVSIDVQGGYRFNQWLAVNAGILVLDDSEESGETDAGSYELRLSTTVVHAGVEAIVPLASFMALTFDAGLDYARVDLEIDEDFFGLKPAGDDSIDDGVLGYHAGLGLRFHWSNFAVGPVLRYRQYSDLFEDDSNYPFDLKLASLGVEFLWQL